MSKRINLAATISMILADPNSSFYQNEADENTPIDDGKKIREAFFKAGNLARKAGYSMRLFGTVAHRYQDEIQQTLKAHLNGDKFQIIQNRIGKSILRGRRDNL